MSFALAMHRSSRAAMLMLLAPALAIAQTGRITGTVTDAGAGPLMGAQVLLATAGLSAASADSGRFTIRSVPAGTYDLKIYLIGYKPQSVSRVTVNAGQDARVAIQLERAAVQLGGVVIAAGRRVQKLTEAPADITALDTSALANTFGNSYYAALRDVIGLEILHTGVNTVYINARGFNSALNSRMLTLEDGRIASLYNSLPVSSFTTIPKLDLAGVEVIVGPGSALYGADASNGVVSVSTKDPKQYPGWAAEFSSGTRDFYDAQGRYAGVNGKWGYKIAGEYQAADDWHDAVTYPAVTAGGSPVHELGRLFRTDVIRGSASLDYYTDDGARLQLTAGASKRDNGLQLTAVGRNQLSNFAYRDYQLQYTGARWFAQLYHTNSNGGDSYNLTSFSLNRARFPALSYDSLKKGASNGLDGRTYAAEVQNNFSVGMLGKTGIGAIDDAHLTWGAQFRHDRVSSWLRTLTDRKTGHAIEVEKMGLYGQVEAPLTAMFRLVFAARYDEDPRWAAQFSPKAGLLFSPDEDQTLRLTYNRAYKAPIIQATEFYNPNFQPNTGQFGNRNGFDIRNSAGALVRTIDPIKPETNDTWELGYKGAIAGRLYVDVTGYHTAYRDFQTGLVNVANPFAAGAAATTAFDHKTGAQITDEKGNRQTVLSFFNVGEATMTGVDAGLRYYFSDRIVASANVSFIKLDTIKIKPTDPQDATAMNSSSSRMSFGMQFNDFPVDFSHGFSIRYVNGYDFRFGLNYGRIPAYGTLDLNANYLIRGSRATVTFQVQNLLACVGGTSTPPVTGLSATAKATYTPGEKCGFGQPHQELLNYPLIGAMAFLGVRWEGR